MIRIVLGNVGSGKTAMIVREMLLSDIPMYSNILTKKVKTNHVIDKTHIFKETIISVKKDGTEVKTYELNKQFWQNLREKEGTISVIIDEAHTLMNPRRSMSKKSQVVTDFMALLRRILGSSESGYGELILISQLERRLDIIAREMATVVQYCVGHYTRHCKNCGDIQQETNETPDKIRRCPYCNLVTSRINFMVEVFNFDNMDKFHSWEYSGRRSQTFYKHYLITDIEGVFSHYDTLQWENLLSD